MLPSHALIGQIRDYLLDHYPDATPLGTYRGGLLVRTNDDTFVEVWDAHDSTAWENHIDYVTDNITPTHELAGGVQDLGGGLRAAEYRRREGSL